MQARLRWRPSVSKWWTRVSSVMKWLVATSLTWPQYTLKISMRSSTSGSPSLIPSLMTFQKSPVIWRSVYQFRAQEMSKYSSTIRVDLMPVMPCSCQPRSRRSSNSSRSDLSRLSSYLKWTPGEPSMPTLREYFRAKKSAQQLWKRKIKFVLSSKNSGSLSNGP